MARRSPVLAARRRRAPGPAPSTAAAARRRPRRVWTASTVWWRLRTHPAGYWALAVGAALATAAVVGGTASRAADDRAAWGPTRSVAVATSSLDRGDVVGADDVAWRDLPSALVPDGTAADPTGRVVVEPVVAGEAVLARRLAPDGLTATAALIPEGRRGVAVPRDLSLPPVEPGDRVDVLSAGAGDPGDPDAAAVAVDALVVAVDDEAVTVAVDVDEAARTVAALGQGIVSLALVGPG